MKRESFNNGWLFCYGSGTALERTVSGAKTPVPVTLSELPCQSYVISLTPSRWSMISTFLSVFFPCNCTIPAHICLCSFFVRFCSSRSSRAGKERKICQPSALLFFVHFVHAILHRIHYNYIFIRYSEFLCYTFSNSPASCMQDCNYLKRIALSITEDHHETFKTEQNP